MYNYTFLSFQPSSNRGVNLFLLINIWSHNSRTAPLPPDLSSVISDFFLTYENELYGVINKLTSFLTVRSFKSSPMNGQFTSQIA